MEKIVVSFTSYPARIGNISKVLNTIREQTIKPDKVVLYLAEKQFQERRLPKEVVDLIDGWFEVRWTIDDLMSHKKYYYAMKDFPDDIIITIDDDMMYKDYMISELLVGHRRFPNCIIAQRVHQITWKSDGSIEKYEDWYNVSFRFLNEPRMDLFATTGGGTLFPPHCFGKEVFNKDVFMDLCKYADDVWLKTMSIIYGIPVVLTRELWADERIDSHVDKIETLYDKYNRDGGNDNQIKLLIQRYGIDMFKECHMPDSISLEQGRRYFEEDTQKKICFILDKIEGYKGAYIYGAGRIGQGILEGFAKQNREDAILGFVISDDQNEQGKVSGKTVCSLSKVIDDIDCIYIVGVSAKLQTSIIEQLITRGVSSSRIITMTSI